MDQATIQKYIDMAVQLGVQVGTKILGAIVLWIVGRMVIRALLALLDRTTGSRKLDQTVARYLNSVAGVLLNILLIIAVLGVFGVETTTFAGVLAAMGVAIGLAWSGLLSNLAAGVFMVVLRPFKVGDVVTAGGVTGVVHSIGLFATTIDTGDNIRTFIGNGKIFGDTIQNYTANPYRRVDCTAQLAHGADHERAIAALRARVAAIPNVAKDPAPCIEIVEANLAGPVLAVRPFTHNDHYWAVYFATNRAIKEELGKLNLPIPGQHMLMTQMPSA
ncbi:MAG: mechanosensitive ion channel family protein [Polyangiaceae bacterium]|nr:mechanosensitive ion channel family protein [Polyangiaceae bacterium]